MLGSTDEANQCDDEQKDTACYQTAHQRQTRHHSNCSAISCYANQDEGHQLKTATTILIYIKQVFPFSDSHQSYEPVFGFTFIASCQYHINNSCLT